MNLGEIKSMQKEIYDVIEMYLRGNLKNNGCYDYHIEGLVIDKVPNTNLWNVKINGQIYPLPVQTGLTITENMRVDVLCRNGDSSKMKIQDLLFW